MTSSIPADDLSASKWWESRRIRYNFFLSVAIVGSWVFTIWIMWAFPESQGCFEWSGFSFVAQLLLATLAIGVANLFYFLGSLTERIVQKRFVATYRFVAYCVGCMFSVTLPMIVPFFTLFQAISGTIPSVECAL